MPLEGAIVCWLGVMSSKAHGRKELVVNYMEVMSLRALSSSSLMALNFSFWEYSSSIVWQLFFKWQGKICNKIRTEQKK